MLEKYTQDFHHILEVLAGVWHEGPLIPELDLLICTSDICGRQEATHAERLLQDLFRE